jgi:hypothetical protein
VVKKFDPLKKLLEFDFLFFIFSMEKFNYWEKTGLILPISFG